MRFQKYLFQSSDEIERILCKLREDGSLVEMAEVYKEAFEGPPWFEVSECSACGQYSGELDFCTKCGNTVGLSEAYPVNYLTDDYFPKTMNDFCPGFLILAVLNEEVVGFTMGGLTSANELVRIKYNYNQLILKGMERQFDLPSNDSLVYFNETCVSLVHQGEGIGTELNFQRVQLGSERWSSIPICGRSINQNWLRVIKKHLSDCDYSVQCDVLDDDDYEGPNGEQRYFIVGQQKR